MADINGDFSQTLAETRSDQRNLFPHSQQVDQWGNGNGPTTVLADNTLAPDGTLTADKLLATAGGLNFYYREKTFTNLIVGARYCFSFHVKSGTADYCWFECPNAGVLSRLQISAASFQTTGSGLTVAIAAAAQGFQRVSASFIAPTGTIRLGVGVAQNGVNNFSPAGTETIFLWGAKPTPGAQPGSYDGPTGAAAADCFAQGAVTAAYAPTLTGPTLTASAVQAIGAAMSGAVLVALVAAGTDALRGSLSLGLPAPALVAVGAETLAGLSSQAFAPSALSASGAEALAGALFVTLPAFALAALAAQADRGAFSGTSGAVGVGVGKVALTGSLNALLSPLGLIAAGINPPFRRLFYVVR